VWTAIRRKKEIHEWEGEMLTMIRGREGGGRERERKKTEDRAESSHFHIYEAVALFACCSVLVHSRSVGSSGTVVYRRITTAATKTDSVA
jgi:hypothetical protein